MASQLHPRFGEMHRRLEREAELPERCSLVSDRTQVLDRRGRLAASDVQPPHLDLGEEQVIQRPRCPQHPNGVGQHRVGLLERAPTDQQLAEVARSDRGRGVVPRMLVRVKSAAVPVDGVVPSTFEERDSTKVVGSRARTMEIAEGLVDLERQLAVVTGLPVAEHAIRPL